MRRESYIDNEYVIWLKSIGCVLYLPLSSDGDLQDRISGNNATITGYGSLSWDSTEQMYLFSMPSSTAQSVLTLETSLAAMPSWTVMCKAKKAAPSGQYVHTFIVTGSYLHMINGTNSSGIVTGDSSNWTQTDVFGYAMTYCSNPQTRTFVIAGKQAKQDSYSASSIPTTSSINIGTVGSWGSAGNIYMGEVYMFNTVLDLATIRKIQGYE